MEFEKVRQIVSSIRGVSIDEIKLETSFADGLSLDSLDIFQITSEIEEAFGIEFSAEDTEKIVTVGDAVEYIKRTM